MNAGKVYMLILGLLMTNLVFAGDKPLKIFIMAGQSNMQGQVKVQTIERLKLKEDSKSMYDDMMGKDHKPAASTALPEFSGNVKAVSTAEFRDIELKQINKKLDEAARKKVAAESPKLKGKALTSAIEQTAKKIAPEVLTQVELKITQTGISNEEFHYNGSAYTIGKIGKAFADSMFQMMQNK